LRREERGEGEGRRRRRTTKTTTEAAAAGLSRSLTTGCTKWLTANQGTALKFRSFWPRTT